MLFLLLLTASLLLATSRTVDGRVYECKHLDQPNQQHTCFVRDISGDLTHETVRFRNKNPNRIYYVTVANVTLGRVPKEISRDFPAIQWFSLLNCSIPTLVGFQPPATLEHLDVSWNKLTKLEDNLFVNATNIKTFIAVGNQISEVHEEFVRGFPKLMTLDLSDNLLTGISEILFGGAGVLAVRLAGNQLSSVDGIFNNLLDLEDLNLARNKLTKIERTTFKDSPNITFLYLNDNQLISIDREAFVTNVKLRTLDLTGNKLKSVALQLPIPADRNSDDFGLNLIDLSRNELIELTLTAPKESTRLAELDLRQNRIQRLSIEPSIDVIKVGLNENALESLDEAAKLSNVRQLDMSENRLTHADLKVLYDLPLNELNVSYAALGYEKIYELFNISTLEMLDVSYNEELFLSQWTIWSNLSSVRNLYFNGLNLEKINPYELKYAFPELKQIQLDDNKFGCKYIKKQEKGFAIMKIDILKDPNKRFCMKEVVTPRPN